jgi:hypothetical protein
MIERLLEDIADMMNFAAKTVYQGIYSFAKITDKITINKVIFDLSIISMRIDLVFVYFISNELQTLW